jgi:oligopeptidase B
MDETNPAGLTADPELTVSAPVADRRPVVLEAHGEQRTDDYFWLRNDSRDDPDVLGYLAAENAYVDASLAHLTALRQTLFGELKGRIRQDDDSVPYRDGDWVYQTRYRAGLEHPIYVRRPASDPSAAESIMLDLNSQAEGHDYYEIGALAVSPNGRLLAYSEDTVSREEYVLRVRDLTTGRDLETRIPGCAEPVAWANDNRTLFYARREPETLRPHRIYRHVLGSDPADDTLVFEERDTRFTVNVGQSRDDRWIIIHSSQTLTDEYRLLDAAAPDGDLLIVVPRVHGHEYAIEPIGETVYILTNRDAPNGRLVEVPLAQASDPAAWRERLAHRDDVLLEDFAVFDGHVVVNERLGGLLGLRVIDRDTGEQHRLETGNPAATSHIAINPTTATSTLRYASSSMATPDTVAEYDLVHRTKKVLRVEQIPGGFDPAQYATETRVAPARDGEQVPVTLLYRRDLDLSEPRPLVQVGYGAYGASYDPEFDTDRFSLVDRGFVYALAHVRGGQERGRRWYDEGRLHHKTNTFTDFIDVTEYLVAEGVADPGRVVAIGRSAGGLLMGAIANLRPDLYAAIIAGVPFVDVVTGMMDPTVPLVTFEYDEWGNPANRADYEYMLGYSPYDQVSARAYPAMFVSAGLYDSRVQYWEPAKWVAKLRAKRTNDAPLYLKTNMQAGHFDASGRFESLRETALEYAFLLDELGVEAPPAP